MINYKKGISFAGSLTTFGFILTIIGILLLFIQGWFLFYGFILIIIGIPLAMNSRGTLIDLENKRIKSYSDYFIFKTGTWEDFKNFNHLVLTKYSDTSTLRSGYIKSTQIQTKTYDIVLKGYTDPIILKEFLDYQEAKKFLKNEGEKLRLEIKNEVEERIQKQSKRVRR